MINASASAPLIYLIYADDMSKNSNLDHAFGPYDPNIYETNGFVPRKLQHHRQSVQQSPAPSASPPDSLRRNGHDAALPDSSVNPSNNLTGQNVHLDPTGDDFTVRARSSSEERESLTPAQSKRKAQNRAAYVEAASSRPR